MENLSTLQYNASVIYGTDVHRHGAAYALYLRANFVTMISTLAKLREKKISLVGDSYKTAHELVVKNSLVTAKLFKGVYPGDKSITADVTGLEKAIGVLDKLTAKSAYRGKNIYEEGDDATRYYYTKYTWYLETSILNEDSVYLGIYLGLRRLVRDMVDTVPKEYWDAKFKSIVGDTVEMLWRAQGILIDYISGVSEMHLIPNGHIVQPEELSQVPIMKYFSRHDKHHTVYKLLSIILRLQLDNFTPVSLRSMVLVKQLLQDQDDWKPESFTDVTELNKINHVTSSASDILRALRVLLESPSGTLRGGFDDTYNNMLYFIMEVYLLRTLWRVPVTPEFNKRLTSALYALAGTNKECRTVIEYHISRD